jgi:hypothetical protein
VLTVFGLGYLFDTSHVGVFSSVFCCCFIRFLHVIFKYIKYNFRGFFRILSISENKNLLK